MTETHELRRATPGDGVAVSRIVRAAYEMYVPRIGREPAPMTADYALLAETANVWLVGTTEDPTGVLVTKVMSDHLLIENVAVLPNAQDRGIGSRLLARAELDAREAGFSELRLYTNAAMTENLEFYPRRGFIQTHRTTQDGFDRVYFVKKLDVTTRAQQEDRPPH